MTHPASTPDGYLSDTEGHRSVDTAEWQEKGMNVPFMVCLFQGRIHYNPLLPGLRSVFRPRVIRHKHPGLLTGVFPPCSLISYCNSSPSLRQLSTETFCPQVTNRQQPKISEQSKQSTVASSFVMLDNKVTLGSGLEAASASDPMSLWAGETWRVSGSHVVILEIWHLGEGLGVRWGWITCSDRLVLLQLLWHKQSW